MGVVIVQALPTNLTKLVPDRKESQRFSVLELYVDPDSNIFSFGCCTPIFQIKHRLLECVFMVFAPLPDPKKYLNGVITSITKNLHVV
jgi:hypothetical protein